MLRASDTTKVTLGSGRLNPALRSRATAQTVSSRPETIRTAHAMTSHLFGGRLVGAGYDAQLVRDVRCGGHLNSRVASGSAGGRPKRDGERSIDRGYCYESVAIHEYRIVDMPHRKSQTLR